MSSTKAKQEFASVPRWFLSLTGTFVASLIVFGIFFSAGSIFAFLITSAFYPPALAFHWLAVFGLVVAFVGPQLTVEEEDVFTGFIEHFNEQDGQGKLVYVMTMFVIFFAMISFEVGVISTVLVYLVDNGMIGGTAIAIAIWFPLADVWAGRKVGVNIASMGALIGLVVMVGVSLAWRVSPTVPKRAAGDIRASFL